MAAIYTEPHQVTYYESDTKNQMTLAMLVNVAILVSERQNDQLGLSDDVVHGYNVGWVVTQYQMEIKRMPQVDETVTFGTTATGYNKYFCYRDYWVDDAQGQRLATIHSAWVLMSYATRNMVAVIPALVQPYAVPEIKGIKRFPRIHHVELADAAQQDYRVRYYDIDANQHVNNVHYFDWMFDHLGIAYLSSHEIVSLNIRYEHELTVDDVAQSHYQITDHVSRHQITTADGKCAEAEVVWRERG
ncbi:acyl-[acyl-carrier-protein] thioesterase [Loigolactobacillus zhaoyuanensis]|uniref:acyl-[acyl-carrier-protein] thioesterase n=1 Tax=Loigolactobacillus zhaoyuanensis TaxID=2486017 RepID=UPI000F735ACB|nr:acyl-ACP thioesterase domain-containing protein [Loigolactobacillus zhaoyuanensis]